MRGGSYERRLVDSFQATANPACSNSLNFLSSDINHAVFKSASRHHAVKYEDIASAVY
jgi:hypothetical protein